MHPCSLREKKFPLLQWAVWREVSCSLWCNYPPTLLRWLRKALGCLSSLSLYREWPSPLEKHCTYIQPCKRYTKKIHSTQGGMIHFHYLPLLKIIIFDTGLKSLLKYQLEKTSCNGNGNTINFFYRNLIRRDVWFSPKSSVHLDKKI